MPVFYSWRVTAPGSLVMPRLNHAMQPALTGALDEYANLEQTFDPAALAVIGDWLEAHTASVQTRRSEVR